MVTLGEPVVGTAVYGPVRTVVWEDGGREAPSYPIFRAKIASVFVPSGACQLERPQLT